MAVNDYGLELLASAPLDDLKGKKEIAYVAAMHLFIREELVRQFGDAGHAIRILYGGSVRPANAGSLLAVPHVGGALVGGASLKPDLFSILVKNVRQVSRPSKIRESQSVRQ